MRLPLFAALSLAACSTAVPTASAGDPDSATASLRAAYARPAAQWPPATVDAGVAYLELGRLPPPPPPRGSASAAAQVALGELLFFDARLSGTGQMACASCHDADLGFADGRTTSFGHDARPLRRNAPSVWNAAHQQRLFWDGRAASLEDQAAMVFENPAEMHSGAAAIERLLASSKGYRERFAAAFGEPTPTMARALQAIAAFERTLVSDGSSAFDRFVAGDRDALDDAAVRGLHLFRTKARCANCHHGPLFSDGAFHNLGLTYYGRKLEDRGRYEVTRAPADVGRFRTPTLRNVTRTAPYMHNGLFDLEGVVNMYSAGMANPQPSAAQQGDPLFPQRSPLLQKLDLGKDEKRDLLAFLGALTDRRRRLRPPELPAVGDAETP